MWESTKTLIYHDHKASHNLLHRYYYQNITNFRQWNPLGKSLEIPWTQMTTECLYVVSWGGKLCLDLADKLYPFSEISSSVFLSYRSLSRRWLISAPFGSVCKKQRWQSVRKIGNKTKARRRVLNIHPFLLLFLTVHIRSLFHNYIPYYVLFSANNWE